MISDGKGIVIQPDAPHSEAVSNVHRKGERWSGKDLAKAHTASQRAVLDLRLN